jgi:hypothetical protein
MLSDAMMRAHLLSALHGLRNSNTGWVPVSDMNFGGLEAVSPGRIHTVCEQLAEAGLIVFKPAPGGPDGGLVGMSKITGHGCDVVDGLAASRIALEFPRKPPGEPASVPAVIGTSDTSPALPGADIGRKLTTPRQLTSLVPETQIRAELFTLKPALWGMSVDLKEAYRRVCRLVWREKVI